MSLVDNSDANLADDEEWPCLIAVEQMVGWVEVEVTGKDGILLRGLSDILLGAGSIRANITLFLNPWTLNRKLPSENWIKECINQDNDQEYNSEAEVWEQVNTHTWIPYAWADIY